MNAENINPKEEVRAEIIQSVDSNFQNMTKDSID